MSICIKFYPKNFNKHTAKGLDLLEKSVQEVGAIESVSIDANGEIVSGNARKEIFDKLGMRPKRVKLKDDEYIVIETNLDGEKRVKAAILANTVAQKNINLDAKLIHEVAVEEFNLPIEDLGVERYVLPYDLEQSAYNEDSSDEDDGDDDGDDGDDDKFDVPFFVNIPKSDMATFERIRKSEQLSPKELFIKMIEFYDSTFLG